VKTLIRAAAVAAALALLALGPAATADDDGGFPPDPNQGTTTSGNPSGGTDSTKVGQVGKCSVVSTSSYMGLACAGGDWNKHSIRETLDGDPLPHCWHDQMSPAETEAMMLSSDGGVTWYWYRCMDGIDPETLKVGPDGVTFTVGVVAVKDPGQLITLTHHQEPLVNMFDNDEQIPAPVAGVSPMARPRVGAWVSFFDGTGDVVKVQAGGVTLVAKVESLKIEPLGAGVVGPSEVDLPLTCQGTGYKALRGDTPATHPGCWFRYQRSSAQKPDQKYPAKITAHWVVDITDASGQTSRFNEFDKWQTTTIPVTEVEALVVQ